MVKKSKQVSKMKVMVKVKSKTHHTLITEEKQLNATNINHQNQQIFLSKSPDSIVVEEIENQNEPITDNQRVNKKKSIEKQQPGRKFKKDNKQYKQKDWTQRTKDKIKQYMKKMGPPNSFQNIWRKVAGLKKVVKDKKKRKGEEGGEEKVEVEVEVEASANRETLQKLIEHEEVNPLLVLQVRSGEYEKQIVSNKRKKDVSVVNEHNTTRGSLRGQLSYEWSVIKASPLFKQKYRSLSLGQFMREQCLKYSSQIQSNSIMENENEDLHEVDSNNCQQNVVQNSEQAKSIVMEEIWQYEEQYQDEQSLFGVWQVIQKDQDDGRINCNQQN